MRKIAVIIYGPPGSGKGTQANMVADALDAVHFDTGKVLEAFVHDPKKQKSKLVQRERKNFDTGILVTPSFVFKVVSAEVKKVARAGFGVVFSGSPRTMYEAENLVPVLEKLYGMKKIHVIALDIPERVSIKRNSARFVCSICKHPLLVEYVPVNNPKYCPRCGGPLYKRTLDNAKTIKVRLDQYKNRTMPIFSFMKKRGYHVNHLDGMPAPYRIFERLRKTLQIGK